MNKILIGIATYNESKNITRLLKEIIINTKNNSDILIVDDNSPDGTSNIVKKFKDENKNIFLIERRKKLGLGSAHKRIILFAQKNNYEKLITMDADFSHQPKEIPKLIKYSSNSNFVTGSRYIKGGKCDYTGYRKYVSFFGNYFARKLLNMHTNELTTSFRIFSKKVLDVLDLNTIRSDGYAFMVEIIYTMKLLSIDIMEIPIHFYDRNMDKSKIPKLQIIYSLLNLFRIFLFKKNVKLKIEKKEKFCKNCNSNAILYDNSYLFYRSNDSYRCLDCGLLIQNNEKLY